MTKGWKGLFCFHMAPFRPAHLDGYVANILDRAFRPMYGIDVKRCFGAGRRSQGKMHLMWAAVSTKTRALMAAYVSAGAEWLPCM